MGPARGLERRELVLAALSPKRRMLVVDLLLSSGPVFGKDHQGGYTAVLQMDVSPADYFASVSKTESWPEGNERLHDDGLQAPFHDSETNRDELQFEQQLRFKLKVSQPRRTRAEDLDFDQFLATGVEGAVRGPKGKQHLEKLWGRNNSLTRVESKVLTRWSIAEAKELRAEEFAMPFVAETAERFEEVSAALTQPRVPVKQRPLNWTLRAIEELFDKRYALEVSEQRAAGESHSENRRKSHDSSGASDHSQDDRPSTASSGSADATASFAVFVLQTYRKKYGLRQLAEASVWELLCNVARRDQQDLHPAISCFAAFLTGHYSSDDLEFFLYCRQKVASELQRTQSRAHRATDSVLVAAALRKEQSVSMTRTVLGKVAGGPLLAELCHAIELHFQSQAETARGRKASRGSQAPGTMSAYQYLKFAVESYRASVVGDEDPGSPALSQEQSSAEEGALSVEDSEGSWAEGAERCEAGGCDPEEGPLRGVSEVAGPEREEEEQIRRRLACDSGEGSEGTETFRYREHDVEDAATDAFDGEEKDVEHQSGEETSIHSDQEDDSDAGGDSERWRIGDRIADTFKPDPDIGRLESTRRESSRTNGTGMLQKGDLSQICSELVLEDVISSIMDDRGVLASRTARRTSQDGGPGSANGSW